MMNNLKALLSLTLLVLATGSRVTKKPGSEATSKDVPIATSKGGSVVTSNTGPAVTNKTAPAVTSNTGPVVTSNTGPVLTSNTGPVATNNTGPVATGNTGPVVTSNTGPVLTSNTGPVATNNTGPVVTSNTGPVLTSNTGPAVTNNTGPVVTNNTESIVINSSGLVVTTSIGPVTTSNTEPVATGNTGTEVANNTGPVVTSNTGPVVTSNTGPVVTSNTGPVVTSKTGPVFTSKPVTGSKSAHKIKSGGPTWGYGVSETGVYGPDDWYKMSIQCKGNNQSPIDIFPQATPFKLANKPMSMESDNALGLVTGAFTNTGHAAQFTVNEKEGAVYLSGGPADSNNYKLSSIQFRVGCMDGSGSEHTLNSKPASAEMQMIFYNRKYKNVNEAVSQPDGIAIIATLFDYYGGFTYYANPTLERFISFLPNITEPGSSVHLDYDDRIELTRLVPELTWSYPLYYTYKGSLTTPPCYESVTWILLKTRLSISIQQLGQFRQLQGRNGNQLCDNFRPIQPANSREVTRNFLQN